MLMIKFAGGKGKSVGVRCEYRYREKLANSGLNKSDRKNLSAYSQIEPAESSVRVQNPSAVANFSEEDKRKFIESLKLIKETQQEIVKELRDLQKENLKNKIDFSKNVLPLNVAGDYFSKLEYNDSPAFFSSATIKAGEKGNRGKVRLDNNSPYANFEKEVRMLKKLMHSKSQAFKDKDDILAISCLFDQHLSEMRENPGDMKPKEELAKGLKYLNKKLGHDSDEVLPGIIASDELDKVIYDLALKRKLHDFLTGYLYRAIGLAGGILAGTALGVEAGVSDPVSAASKGLGIVLTEKVEDAVIGAGKLVKEIIKCD